MKTGYLPSRTCLACGKKQPQQALVRIERNAEGFVKISSGKGSSGRGAYLCTEEKCWERGMDKGLLDRALRLTISSGIKQQLKEQHYQQLFLSDGKEAS